MSEVAERQWELALEQPGSADQGTVRRAVRWAVAILLLAGVVAAFGPLQLAAFPQFATFQAGFVFVVDAITGWVLLGQFHYRRQPIYALLACAYLFNALVMVPFLLTFPGALLAQGGVLGGSQSSIWVWHLWHTLFPALVIASLLVESRFPKVPVPRQWVVPATVSTIGVALALATAVLAAVTVLHDRLPHLIDEVRRPLTMAFYVVGGAAALVTAVAMAMSWRRGLRSRTILHVWLAVVLTAFLADNAASLRATARYTVGWYFGRVEAMIAGSVLLLVFLRDINLLYRRLGGLMRELSAANAQLHEVVEEKDALVADLRRSEEQVRELAYYDTLTSLPNRRLLLDRLGQALAQAKRHRHLMAILFMDLDGFKQINDSLGHDVGDALLREVAARLTTCVRGADTVSRPGGDEFIVALAEIAHPEDAAQVAEKVLRALAAPVAASGHRLLVTASLGIAIFPDDGADVLELMKKADRAMYAAKEAGRNRYRFYRDLALPAATADVSD